MDRSCVLWSWYSPRLPLSKVEPYACDDDDEAGKKGSGGHNFSFRTLSGLPGCEWALFHKDVKEKSISAPQQTCQKRTDAWNRAGGLTPERRQSGGTGDLRKEQKKKERSSSRKLCDIKTTTHVAQECRREEPLTTSSLALPLHPPVVHVAGCDQ